MKLIITGVAGFIGSHIAEHYLRKGDTVIGIDNLSRPGNVNNLKYLNDIAERNRFCFVHGDIRCAGDIDRTFLEHTDAGAIVHEAGQVAVTTSVRAPRFDFESNALGTLNVLEAARVHIPQAIFLFASTNKVYGSMEHLAIRKESRRYVYADTPNGVDESEPLDFHSPYGCSKGAAEQYVRDYYRIYGLKSVVFRQSCIYGSRQYGMEDQGWVAWFTLAALVGKPLTVFGDGKQIRDVLWISDLVRVYDCALNNIDKAAGQVFNVGGGKQNTLSLLELLGLLESALGHRIEHRFDDWRPGDQRVFVADCSKAERLLGWSPRISPAEGVPLLLDWARHAYDDVKQIAGVVPGT